MFLETQHHIDIVVQLQLDEGTADALKVIASLLSPNKKNVTLVKAEAPKTKPTTKATEAKPEAKPAATAKAEETKQEATKSAPAKEEPKPESTTAKSNKTAPTDTPAQDDLPKIRQQVSAFVNAHPADGKQQVKAWLEQHGYRGVSVIERKDWDAFEQFLKGGEQVA